MKWYLRSIVLVVVFSMAFGSLFGCKQKVAESHGDTSVDNEETDMHEVSREKSVNDYFVKVDDDMSARIKEDYIRWFSTEYPQYSPVEESGLTTLAYEGLSDGAVAVCFTYDYYLYIRDYNARQCLSFPLRIWRDGQFYSVKEEYRSGRISIDEVRAIASKASNPIAYLTTPHFSQMEGVEVDSLTEEDTRAIKTALIRAYREEQAGKGASDDNSDNANEGSTQGDIVIMPYKSIDPKWVHSITLGDDLTVLMMSDELVARMEPDVHYYDGVVFYSDNTLKVWDGQKVYPFATAYEQGVITAQEVDSLRKVFYSMGMGLSYYASFYFSRAILPSEETAEAIKTAYCQTYLSDDPTYDKERLHLHYFRAVKLKAVYFTDLLQQSTDDPIRAYVAIATDGEHRADMTLGEVYVDCDYDVMIWDGTQLLPIGGIIDRMNSFCEELADLYRFLAVISFVDEIAS